MLVTRTKYDADMAAKDAELSNTRAASRVLMARINRMARDNADLRARLTPFTAPRARDGAGRFLPLPAGDMGEVRA